MADLPSFSTEEFYWLASCFWGIITCKLKTTMLGNIPSPFATEAMVCFQAAVMGLQMDLSRVEIKDDSFTFIRKLQANRVERSILGAYICNIKTICIRFQMCQNKQMKGLNYWLLSD
ncbi:hypothetical protein ES332_A09G289500v1 [Gossypium tomentosum]|nr:hypothetical protein ES332_A09G289500v1 [Gossypium tomentosum]